MITRYLHLKKTILPKGGLAVDVDDTICATNEFWSEYLLREYGNPEKLTPEQIVQKYRFVRNVPYWNEPKVRQWIDGHMNSSEGKLHLKPKEGSVKALQSLQDKINLYLTGRPEYTNEATTEWQRREGFPAKTIIGFPDMPLDDRLISIRAKWKARILEALFPEVSGIIDDDEGVAKRIDKNYPGKIFLYSYTQYNKDNVVCCPTWSEVVYEVNRFKA
jgi:hypothetical protein